jgi:hypothetical protein
MRSTIFDDFASLFSIMAVEFDFQSFHQIYDTVIEELEDNDYEEFITNSYISKDSIENWIGCIPDIIDTPEQMDLDERWIVPITYNESTPRMAKNTLQILLLLYSSTRHYSSQRHRFVRRSIQLFRFRILYEILYSFSAHVSSYLTPRMKRQITKDLEESIGKTFHVLYCDMLRYGSEIFQDTNWRPAFHYQYNRHANTSIRGC